MIYVLTHKPTLYKLPDNSIYKPLQVAAEQHLDLNLSKYKDNCGNNIGNWNPVYGETTGQYQIAYNLLDSDKDKFIGQCQYRRQLLFRETTDFEAIFNDFKCITCKPLLFAYGETVMTQFARCHSEYYIRVCSEIITKMYPEYSESISKYWFYGNKLYYSNGFILPREEYLKYSDFLFSVLDAFRSHEGLYSVADFERYVSENIEKGIQKANNGFRQGYNYDLQVLAFLSERIWTLWARHNYEGFILEMPYTLKENTGI